MVKVLQTMFLPFHDLTRYLVQTPFARRKLLRRIGRGDRDVANNLYERSAGEKEVLERGHESAGWSLRGRRGR